MIRLFLYNTVGTSLPSALIQDEGCGFTFILVEKLYCAIHTNRRHTRALNIVILKSPLASSIIYAEC